MKGLIAEGNGVIRLSTDIPMPKVEDYTAIVKTLACGICNGTDLKLRAGHLRGFSTYPAVIGHEAVGQVVEIGRNVRNFKLGDYVLRSGLPEMLPQYHSLWGSFAEYGQVADYAALREGGKARPADIAAISQQVIPSWVDPMDGTMIITLKEVYSAMKRLGIFKGAKVAIAGCGPVGLSMVRFCKLLGASFVGVSGHHASRMAVAKKIGADLVVDSKKTEYVAAVREACSAPLDFFIDAVGRCDILAQALQLIREDGTVGIYGIGMEQDKGIDWYAGPYNWRIHSVQWPIPTLEAAIHGDVVQYIADGQVDLKDFVTHTLPIEAFEKGFSMVQNREGLKVVLYF